MNAVSLAVLGVKHFRWMPFFTVCAANVFFFLALRRLRIWPVLAFLLVLGLITLSQILDLSALSKVCLRRAGRIRHWFWMYAPSINDNLPYTVTDSRPPFLEKVTLRGVEAVLLLINATIAAILTGLTTAYFFPSMFTLAYAIGTSIVCFLLTWVLQILYVRNTMKNWERLETEMGMVKFPPPKGYKHDNH